MDKHQEDKHERICLNLFTNYGHMGFILPSFVFDSEKYL